MKDNFSAGSARYKQFRPVYPQALFDYLSSLCPTREQAWDCGTGNGQIAFGLSAYFQQVTAEHTSAAGHSFDLITVAQAIHWFDFDAFYAEVQRTIKPGGVLAVIGYNLMQADPETDAIIRDFYDHIIGPYWDPERRYIDEGYATIPFPFREITTPELAIEMQWTLPQLLGYLRTWSAVKHYITAKQEDPVLLIESALHRAWANRESMVVSFPLKMRVAVF